MEIFTVYDSKAEAYLQPFFLKTKAMAIREITDAANNPEHQFGKYPQDYVLFHIGSYNEDTATITQDKTTSLGVVIEFKTQIEMPLAAVE